MDRFIRDLCVVANLTSIIGLTVLALKRNRDAYKAGLKVVDLEWDVFVKDMELNSVKRELENLKANKQ